MTGFLRLSIRGRCLAVLVLLSVIGACGARTSAIADPITLALKDGPVTGLVENGVLTVKGVPFAAPPVGELRWRPTQKVAPWTAPRAAEHFSAACPQTFNPESSAKPEPISEDCLYLNVWAPAKAGSKRLPVMVWIHGGSWTNGSGSRPLYDGTRFAHDGVILVTFNYRLGALGFFAHPALTAEAAPDAPLFAYGHLDQIAALQWVQANIARFGGDPGDVTVFGESAGAGSLLALLSIPQTQGLFARAIVESAPAMAASWNLSSELWARAGSNRRPRPISPCQKRSMPASSPLQKPASPAPTGPSTIRRPTRPSSSTRPAPTLWPPIARRPTTFLIR